MTLGAKCGQQEQLQPTTSLKLRPQLQQAVLPGCNWLRSNKTPVAVTSNAVRLFCIPQAGTGAWVFQTWAEKLAPGIQVLPIELPGHGARQKEPCLIDLCQLSQMAVENLAAIISQGPYALFGHSMGAWIAWEMLQEIVRRGLPLPVRLYVSGNRAPSLHAGEHDVDPTRLHQLSPEEFWVAFERRYGTNKHLMDANIRAAKYPMLRDDFAMLETYQPSADDFQTGVPTVAIGARLDNRYKPQQISAWRQHTQGDFQEQWLDDVGHSYIADAPNELMATLQSQLSQQHCCWQQEGHRDRSDLMTGIEQVGAAPADADARSCQQLAALQVAA